MVFRSADGRTITRNDLDGLTGTFSYEILGEGNVSAQAKALHQQARQAGGAGEYETAIALLKQAASLAPRWAYPVYDLAYTYLLSQNTESAREYYRKTVELEPRGFFTAITALDALDREFAGDLPVGTYMAYLSLEWMNIPAQRAEAVRQLVERAPGFAPAWKELALLSDNDSDTLAAIEKGLVAQPDAETKGILLINKAMALDRQGDHDGACQLLGELALDPKSTYATEHLARVTLAMVAAE